MEEIIMHPTLEIKKVCVLLEQLIHHFLNPPTPYDLGEFEFKTECYILIGLIIRDVESITTLGKSDLVLLPSAMNLARSALEKAIIILWILNPDDPFNREVRWLAQIKTEEDYLARISRRMNELGVDNQEFLKNKDAISKFRMEVIDVLPKPYEPLKERPDVASMMKAIGELDRYPIYSALSQYTHGTHAATGLYRKGLGIYKEIGEYTSPDSWAVILDVCKYSLVSAGGRFIQALDGDVSACFSKEILREIDDNIVIIGKTKSSHGAGKQAS